MSLEMDTFVPAVDGGHIPLWLSRMRELGMVCEIHPGFSFDTHSGFLPFKLRIQDSSHADLNGIDFMTGFEYYISDFSLEAEQKALLPRRSFLGGVFGNKPALQPYASPDIDQQLQRCSKRLQFVWGSADLFELRMATVSSAVLAEITGGVSSYPADGIWYDRSTGAIQAVSEARDYENSVKQEDMKLHRFEQWL
jgi:hypothetical protein